jgi:hypothetical protein
MLQVGATEEEEEKNYADGKWITNEPLNQDYSYYDILRPENYERAVVHYKVTITLAHKKGVTNLRVPYKVGIRQYLRDY